MAFPQTPEKASGGESVENNMMKRNENINDMYMALKSIPSTLSQKIDLLSQRNKCERLLGIIKLLISIGELHYRLNIPTLKIILWLPSTIKTTSELFK